MMRFENFHLNKTDFFKSSLEDTILLNGSPSLATELPDASVFIRDSSYLLEGISWGLFNKPLSEYAKNHFSYIQTFAYYELENYYTKRQNLDSFQLKYTYEGEGELIYCGKTHQLGPNQGYVIDCRKPHEYHIKKKPWKHSEIHFFGTPSSFIMDQFSTDDIVCFEVAETIFQPEIETLLTLHESIIPYRELQISHQLEHILLMILCRSDSYQQTINKIPENLHFLLSYIDLHYMEPLTLDYLAEFSNISKFHLCKLFQKYLGLSPKEYILQLRIENAKNLLRNTTIPANKIASMVGINDENYFYRLFKSKVGMSANDFRKK